MSAKFKPKKKEVEAKVDEWDASGGSDEENEVRRKLSVLRIEGAREERRDTDGLEDSGRGPTMGDAWGDGEAKLESNRKVSSGRSLWQEANSKVPQAQPIIEGNRSLPTTLLAPRVSASNGGRITGSGNAGTLASAIVGEYDARPPPLILRRDRAAEAALRAGAAHDSAMKQRTIAEREQEYKLARERIFGNVDIGVGVAVGKQGSRSKPNSRTGSGSDTGGRNSPSGTTLPSSHGSGARKR